MIKVSIIIPVYNVEQYLEECVNSVLSQSYGNFELILVDDGSPDSSGAIADDLSKADSRIRVVHQENQGLSGARNTGIRASTGEYLMFLDSDDWWKDDTVLEAIVNRLENNPCDALSFNYQKIYDDRLEPPYFSCLGDAPTDASDAQSFEYVIQNGLWVTGACNKAVRRKTVIENELFFKVGITSEDIDWTMRLALCAKRVDFLNKTVFVYRQRSASISHTITQKAVRCLCQNVSECVRLANEADEYKRNLLMPFVAYQYATLIYNFASLGKKERGNKLYEDVKSMAYLLGYSKNKKAQLINFSCKLFGFNGALFLLRTARRFL